MQQGLDANLGQTSRNITTIFMVGGAVGGRAWKSRADVSRRAPSGKRSLKRFRIRRKFRIRSILKISYSESINVENTVFYLENTVFYLENTICLL